MGSGRVEESRNTVAEEMRRWRLSSYSTFAILPPFLLTFSRFSRAGAPSGRRRRWHSPAGCVREAGGDD
eukprot:6010674-Pyramimonas_sp.AAC.1